MDWILDNLQIVIAVAGAIAYWLNARRKDKAGEPADYDGDGEPDNVPGGGRAMRDGEREMEQAEATRRIQEEIRRKIAERAGRTAGDGGSRTIPPFEQPVPPPMPVRRREPELAPYAREARREETEREAALVLERQRGLAEQYAALKARKAEAGREAKSVWAAEGVAPARGAAVAHGRKRDDLGLLAELRNARSLKKAIVLREVLGAPVGLR